MNQRQAGNDSERRIESFSGGKISGEVVSSYRPAGLVEEVLRLIDPSAALETVHWGRNYLYAAEFRAADGPLPVVVKQFRIQGRRRAIERKLRGSKAIRSWHAAHTLTAAGIHTPEPLLLVESDRPDGPSFFVTRRIEDSFEVRHFFRRLSGDPAASHFPDVDAEEFLTLLGGFARRIHDAGVWFRDLSMGNVLAVPEDGGLDLFVVDLNRVRIGIRMGTFRRIRDTCRFPIIERNHREAFLRGYWGKIPGAADPRWWLWVASVRGYLLKHAVKNRMRRVRLGRRHSHGGSHHPHLPDAAAGASVRDQAVWDRLSDQPHQHAGRWDKLVIRLADAPGHLRDAAIVALAAPSVWRRSRQLRSELYRHPVGFSGVGICLRPYPADPAAHLAAVEELGVRRVMIRLQPWQDGHADEERLARSLADRGFEISYAVPQNRDLVRDRARWRSAIRELAERFTPFGRAFQVGQAPNRSKWGVWTRSEFVDLYVEASEILRRFEGVEVIGPSVIDFEFQFTLALVNRRHPGLVYDALSSLLYVDRRGAPENRQLGLDTVDKVVLLRAIADVGRNSTGRCWITEFNWPLWEGPHSPAGRAASVDEQSQANFLARYFLLALGTGLVERVYWWRLLARGYGLMAPETDGTLRRRASFHALRTLTAQLEDSTFMGPLATPKGSWLYRFSGGGRDLVVGWSLQPAVTVELPAPVVQAIGLDGNELPLPDGTTIALGSSPVYYVLED